MTDRRDVLSADNRQDLQPQKSRLFFGAVVFVLSQALPFCVPSILNSGYSSETEAILSGILIFGLPEIGTMLAVAIMGKQGYEWLKSKLFASLSKLRPKSIVSKTRYNIGLTIFIALLLLAFLDPYISPTLPFIEAYRREFVVGLDVLFVLSLFILGGDFWEKLRSLFVYENHHSVQSNRVIDNGDISVDMH